RAAVDADAGLVESGPEDADGAARAGGEIVEIFRALAALQDAGVVAEPREWHGAGDAPLAGGRGVFGGAGGDGEGGDEAAVFADAEDLFPQADGDVPRFRGGGGGGRVGG